VGLVAIVVSTPYRKRAGTGRAVDVELASGSSDDEVVARL
jgi:hypothetical protein